MRKSSQYIITAVLVFLIALIGGMTIGQQKPNTSTPEEVIEVIPTPMPEPETESGLEESAGYDSITFDQTTLTITMGETLALVANPLPADANDSLYWYTMDDETIYVDETGVLTPLQPGVATIVAQSNENQDLEAHLTVEVLPSDSFVQVESIEINYKDFNNLLSHGDQTTLNVTVYPANATRSDLKFSTLETEMITLSDSGQVEAIGGVGYAYITVTSQSNPAIYERVRVRILPLPHPDAEALTYTAGALITKANTEWDGWFRMTGLSVQDLEPMDYATRFTESLGTNVAYDSIIAGNAHDYPEMCQGGLESTCKGIDAFIQLLKFDEEANEAVYRLLAVFAPNDLEAMKAIFDKKDFTGGSYYFNGRWFHIGYMDYGLDILVSGQEK